MTIDPGLYRLEAWGAAGGRPSEALIAPGGYSRGNLLVSAPLRLFTVAGDVGGSAFGSSKVVPGGGNGKTYMGDDYSYSGGGGASHFAALQSSLEHRILVAGGAGGSASAPGFNREAKGGMGGGESGSDGEITSANSNGNGKGAGQTVPGSGCASGQAGCVPGSFGSGGSTPPSDGCGGGRGWFGGASSKSDSAGGGGGSGFVFEGRTGTGCEKIDRHPLLGELDPLTNTEMKSGENSGRGRVKITCIKKTLRPTETVKKCESKVKCGIRGKGVVIVRLALLMIE